MFLLHRAGGDGRGNIQPGTGRFANTQLAGKAVKGEGGVRAEDTGTLDGMLKFSDITGPGIIYHFFDSFVFQLKVGFII